MRLAHLIEEQRLQIDVAPHLAGPVLLDRIGEINRRRLVPAIAQVLDEFALPGQLVSIGTLHLALGRFEPDALDRVEAVLRARLREALAAALRAGSGVASAERHALVAAFEHYLLHGAWPSNRAIPPATSPAEMLETLLEGDPLALVAMLRRRGPGGAVLRRLVRQMPDRLLARLLHRLEPVHAAYVLNYLAEVCESHAAERLIAASPAELTEMLWTIVLRDALQEAGLQANRKAFLRRLLGQLARSAGARLSALVAQLRRGLPRTLARRKAPGSLVAILEELIAEAPELTDDGAALGALASLLGRAPRLSERERATARRLAATVGPRRLRALLDRLGAGDPLTVAMAIESVLPAAPFVAPPHFSAGSADGPGAADAPAGTWIVALRRAPHDRPRSLRAPRRHAKPEEREDPVDRLAAALAALAAPARPGEMAGLDAILADAMHTDPYAARRLMRRFATAEPDRLARLLGGGAAFREAAAWLLPAHLAAGLAALDRIAGCTAAERRALLAVAASARDAELPEALLARALAALARSRAVTPAAFVARLKHAATAPSPEETALLASLGMPHPQATRRLATRHRALDQFALVCGEMRGLALHERVATLVGLLPALSGADRASLQMRLPAGTAASIAARGLLMALPPFALRRLALLFAIPKQDLRDAAPNRLAARIAGRVLGDMSPGRRAPDPRVSKTPQVFGTDFRRAATIDPAEVLIGGGVRERLRIAAMMRLRPFGALRLLTDPDETSAAPIPLLHDPHRAPLLFAAMAREERAHLMRLLDLLTGRRGRLAIAPAKVARALARAAAARDWRAAAGRGLADEWRAQLAGLASLSEQAALRRLLGDLAPDTGVEARDAATTPSRRSSPGILDRARALLGLQPRASTGAILRALADSRLRTRLARASSEEELVRLLAALTPAAAGGLLHAAERLAAARRAGGAPIDRAAQWHCILGAAASARPIPHLASAFLDGADDAPPPPAPARQRSEALLVAALEGMRDAPLRMALDLRARERRARVTEAAETDSGMPVTMHIHNAGLVLAAIFLPRLFQSLDYAEETDTGWRWTDTDCPGRAVHLLQWLADERSDAPEPQLALNKILCGLDPADPVAASVALTGHERDRAQSLLARILSGWPPLAGSSIAALRETFFQREGRLTRSEHRWSLEVETRVLDILLDQLPWSFSTILHPWMRNPLAVRWR
ncbi:hypothetical protein FHS95_002607 [Sphingomonas naasensis]|uniref:Uncharacterized protein n=1 Tax=Sphingomonas naasensis TaxID=1344951 RepID=A0A4S1WLJ6_9SPHN|nr:contractile injection system tape measure protein [Sphingomonas naasensis]NIJ20915.1 hypothetical protein [Sphingomonas naasensis]TGX43305.1 hypothetical protein E5A74_09070 [Sphingomonas naasensis]